MDDIPKEIRQDLVERGLGVVVFVCADSDGYLRVLSYDENAKVNHISEKEIGVRLYAESKRGNTSALTPILNVNKVSK